MDDVVFLGCTVHCLYEQGEDLGEGRGGRDAVETSRRFSRFPDHLHESFYGILTVPVCIPLSEGHRVRLLTQ